MTRTTTSPLDYSEGFSLSSLQRIRLAYSSDIVQQLWKTETEIVTPVLFDTDTGAEEWIVDWSKGDFDFAEFGIQEQVSENGTTENYNLKVIFETGITQLAFKKWFDKKLRKQQVCVVATDSNDKERAFNPFEVTYRYISSGNESENSKYELTFTRTMLIEVFQDDHILGIIKTCGENMATEVKINFISNKNSHYLIGLSKIDNANGVETWISGELPFENIEDGVYYLFAKHKNEAFNVLMSAKIIIDCYVCKLSFKGWEEFFECEVSFSDWEEITEYEVSDVDIVTGVKAGNLGIIKFSSKEHVFQSFDIPATQINGKAYFDKLDSISIGTVVYSDKTMNNKFEIDRWYGIKDYKGSNWAFRVNELSIITEISKDFKQSKSIGFLMLFPVENVAKTKLELSEVAARGIDSCYLTISLGEVFTDMTEYNSNSASFWAKYDEVINHANALFSSVCLHICCDFDDTKYFDITVTPAIPKTNPIFNLFTDIAQDEWGNPARIGRGSGHACLAKDTARSKMTGFVSKVLQRYVPILGTKINSVSFGNAAQLEGGYNYENQFWSNDVLSDAKTAMFDYNPAAQYDFANNFCREKYVNLANAERVHGKSYNAWNDIVPPKTDKPSLLATTSEEINSLFNSQLGLDWYMYRYSLLKKYWLECVSILKAYAPNAKHTCMAGSFTDDLTALRGLFDVADIATYADVFKAQFTSVNWNGTANVSAAVLANNIGDKEIETEINENDPVTQGKIYDPELVKTAMFEAYKSAIANGASKVWLIANSGSIYWQNSLSSIEEWENWRLQNQRYRVTNGVTVNIPISKFIKNYSAAHADCIAAGLNTGLVNRPIIKLIKDI